MARNLKRPGEVLLDEALDRSYGNDPNLKFPPGLAYSEARYA
jgi:hypothetical protein